MKTIINNTPTYSYLKGRGATRIIAATNAESQSKNGADYTAEADAQPTIMEALDDLPSGGGHIHLTEGTFTLLDEITLGELGPSSNLLITGCGASTILKMGANISQNVIGGSNLTGITIANLQIDGNKTQNTPQSNDDLQNGILMDQWYKSVLDNVLVQNCEANGIRIKTRTGTASPRLLHNQLSHITSVNNTGNGLFVDTWAEYMNIGRSSFSNNGGNGVQIESANISFDGCVIIQNTLSGVYLNASDKSWNNTFTGCQVNHNTEHGFYLNNVYNTIINASKIIANLYHGIYVYDGENHIITGNTISTNSYGNDNLYDNVCLANAAIATNVSHNFISRSSGAARYGINEVSGCQGNIFIGNYISSHQTAPMSSIHANSVSQHNIT